jgi:hypothetical protein
MAELHPIEYESHKKNRFVVILPEIFAIQSFLIQKINKPKMLHGVWQDFHIEFFDIVADSVSPKLIEMLNYCNVNRNNPLFTMILVGIDPVGLEIERWVVPVSEIVSVDFGEYDYGNADAQTVKVILRPSSCILNNSTVNEWEKYFKRTVLIEKYSSK